MNQNRFCLTLELVASTVTNRFRHILLSVALVLSLISVETAGAREVFIQTGFEKFALGQPPKEWDVRGGGFEVTDDIVKTDKKSLAILGGANDDRIGVAIKTQNSVITVEFWVYIKSGGRSFNLKIASAENIAQNDGGAYINWNANTVRLYDGAAWQPISDFDTDTWRYVRVVADVDNSTFDFYAGDDRNKALGDRGKKGLPFRRAAVGPVAKWVIFHVYSISAPGYVDDLFVYEGGEPINLAVAPAGKLTTVWGHIKRHSSAR